MSKNIGEIFIEATRARYTFELEGSVLDVSDLWRINMRRLDEVYGEYSSLLKETDETNTDSLFDNSEKDEELASEKEAIENKLEIIRYIFNIKKEEADAVRKAAERKAQRNRIAELILKKKNEEFESLGLEDLEKMLDDLND